MLGMGFGEMVLIAGIALVVIGPEKFPEFAKLVIRTVRDLRGYVDDVKTEVTRELSPIKKEVDSLSRIDPEKYIDSLTAGDVDDSDPNATSNPALNEEDRKVMAAGMDDEYADDPYGWQEGDTDYTADKGAYPEDTVGYGEVDLEEGPSDTPTAPDAEEATAESDDDAVEADASEAEADEVRDNSHPEDDRIELIDPGETDDVWTGR